MCRVGGTPFFASSIYASHIYTLYINTQCLCVATVCIYQKIRSHIYEYARHKKAAAVFAPDKVESYQTQRRGVIFVPSQVPGSRTVGWTEMATVAASVKTAMPVALGVFTCRVHTYYIDNQLFVEKVYLNTYCLFLNVSCLPDGICPHQVRFARVLALLDLRYANK